jgi:uncharacterized protein YbaA (DUF1428 family)
MTYIDSIVTPVLTARLDEYRKLAELSADIWLEHGALNYQEGVAEDVQPGKLTSFPQALQLKADETVVVAWVTYASREQRDAVMDKVMADPRLIEMMQLKGVPFDAERMFWGGFKTLVMAPAISARHTPQVA